MNILHLSNTPLSNSPANLVQSLNHCGHQATLLLHRKSNVNKVYVGGTLWDELSLDRLTELFRNAEVLHFHNYAWEQRIFKEYPQLLTVAKTKPSLIQYHSPRDSIENFETSIADKTLKHAVIGQYHVRQYPECEFVVPNVVPLFDPKYQPLNAKWESMTTPTVSYAPSNTSLKGWDDKGYDIVMPVLQQLERSGQIVKDSMVGVPYEECMMRKRWAHIGIDEIVTGSYHLSGLEYLAMGCVTIGYLDELTLSALSKIVPEEGMRQLPWILVNKEDMRPLRSWISPQARSELHERANYSRRWMETYWSVEANVKRFEGIYQSL